MSAITKGTAHVFGVDGKAGITVSSYSVSEKPGVDEVVLDEQGRTIAMHMDDMTKELSLEGFVPVGGSYEPAIGDTLTYRSVSWIIKEVERRGEAKGFTKLSLKGVKYEQIA
jgi:hypothetical protein